MNKQIPPPIPNSYQVDLSITNMNPPGQSQLWGGEYPGHDNTQIAQERITQFLDRDITHFINLTEADERLDHYEGLLAYLAAKSNKEYSHIRIPIQDYSIPSRQLLTQILDTIDSTLAQGENVYVHCWGGIGRTGTVIGSWLVRHGLNGQQALAVIAQWRQGIPSGKTESPETADQRKMILTWHE